MVTPCIIGTNKSMWKERGVRQTRSEDRKRPQTSKGGAELDLVARVIGIAPTSVFTQEEGRDRAREVPVYSLPTCEAQRSSKSDGEAAEWWSKLGGGALGFHGCWLDARKCVFLVTGSVWSLTIQGGPSLLGHG